MGVRVKITFNTTLTGFCYRVFLKIVLYNLFYIYRIVITEIFMVCTSGDIYLTCSYFTRRM